MENIVIDKQYKLDLYNQDKQIATNYNRIIFNEQHFTSWFLFSFIIFNSLKFLKGIKKKSASALFPTCTNLKVLQNFATEPRETL